jgi:hypothetical protein
MPSYPRDPITPEEIVSNTIRNLQVEDRNMKRRDSTFRPRPLNFKRIYNVVRFSDIGETSLESILKKLVREGKVLVTGGIYYLPNNFIRLLESTTTK